MNKANILSATEWAHAFGLAEAPLFGDEVDTDDQHQVMLDGGYGTFALSLTNHGDIDPANAASWAWSSDIPHHVSVDAEKVVVTRWDSPSPRRFSTSSVSSQFDRFYQYLVQDRVDNSGTIVRHLVDSFRSIRTGVSQEGADDSLSLGAFLSMLADLSDGAPFEGDVADVVGPDAHALYQQMKLGRLQQHLQRTRTRKAGFSELSLFSRLAIRHAGGLIFQEAHFELMRTPEPSLFGFLDAPEVKPLTRGGAHFTPPAVARSVVEQALQQLGDMRQRKELVVCDPACGSGAFLLEALRALRRAGFDGKLVLVGRDISNHAVVMAKFASACAASDWSPKGGLTVDIRAEDSLEPGCLPESDLIVMNPPFIAAGSLNDRQKGQISDILGKLKQGRADLSMAFILQALNRLKPDGVLGTLFPASLLELKSAAAWRKALQDYADLRFLGLIGDHGLFSYAMVQVATGVFKRSAVHDGAEVLTLWSGKDKDATGEALRGLRRVNYHGMRAAETRRDWRVRSVPRRAFQDSSNWKLLAPSDEFLLSELNEVIGTKVGDLFDVRQGMRTGANSVFVISEGEWKSLPRREQVYFLPAVVNRSISRGKLEIRDYVFYPYEGGAQCFDAEQSLAKAIPVYFEKYLKPNKNALTRRAMFGEGGNRDWWELTRRRTWTDDTQPRIISKYFGGVGGFVPDIQGKIAVVQGYAWYFKSPNDAQGIIGDTQVPELVMGYAALFNTSIFERLVSVFSMTVAGGQYDLSPRYVNGVPCPDLLQHCIDGTKASLVFELCDLGKEIDPSDERWMSGADRLVSSIYGVKEDAWR